MGTTTVTSVSNVRVQSVSPPAPPSVRSLRPFFIFLGALCVAFSPWLYKLIRYSFAEDFYSHIILIPFISGYLIWQKKTELPRPSRGSAGIAAIPALLGSLVLAMYFTGPDRSLNDSLTLTTLSFVLFLFAGAWLLLGRSFIISILFPVLFLAFMVPLPTAVTNTLEIASQKASADVYAWMLELTRVSYLRDGQVFALPGLTLQVAQECSGIRSSFVLFITSLLAGYMFLQNHWKRFALAAIVIPLGLVRNGFRIWVLSILTIHWNPDVIHSPLHHRGGPIFFALSLIPFFALLLLLRKSERRRSSAAGQQQEIRA